MFHKKFASIVYKKNWYRCAFSKVAHYPDIQIVPQSAAQLPWGHISVLIHKVKEEHIRIWHAEQTVDQGWSRVTLERHIKIIASM